MKEKIKQFWNKHKKGIIITLATVAGVFTGVIIKKKKDNDDYYEEINDFDPGRDCKMIFEVDDESKEILGEVPCTESYAKDMIEIYSNDIED